MADIQTGLILDDSQYTGKINQAITNATTLKTKFDELGKNGKEGFAKLAEGAESVRGKMESLGALMVGAGLTEFLKSTLEGSAKMVDLANAVGVTVQSMMEFQLAGIAAGRSGEDMANMLQRMNVAAITAADGNTKMRGAFEKVGVSFDYMKTHSPDEVFNKIAHSLAAMEDPSKRAALAMEMFGKPGRMVDWKDLTENLDRYNGSQKQNADATEAAKKAMDEMAVGAQMVKNELVLLVEPVVKWFGSFIEGAHGSKIAAEVLAGAMGLFAAAGTITAISAIANGVKSLVGFFVADTVAVSANTVALDVNREAYKFRASAIGVLGTATKNVIVAEEALNAAMATGVATTAELTALENALTVARERQTVATTVAARTNAAFAGVQQTLAVAEGEAALGANAAAAGVTRLGAAAAGAETAAAGLLGRLAMIASVGAALMFYSPDLNEGEDKKIEASKRIGKALQELSKEELDQYFKLEAAQQHVVTNAIQAGKSAKDALKNVLTNTDEKGDPKKTPMLGEETAIVDKNAAIVQGLKNQYDMIQETNTATQARIALETQLVGKSDEVRAKELGAFDANIARQKELLRLEGQIQVLRLEQANSGTEDVNNEPKIAELRREKELVDEQYAAMAKLKEQLVKAQDAQKITTYEMENQLKVEKELKDLQLQTSELTMTADEKRFTALQRQINEAILGEEKLRKSQLGLKANEDLPADEKTGITDRITAQYAGVKQQTQALIDQSRTFDTGWTSAWKNFADNATNEANRAKEMFDTFEKSFESVFEQMVRTGKVNWNSLLQDMTVALMKSDVQRLFAGLTAPSGSSSNIFGSIGKMFSGAFAGGGDIPAGGYGLVGESGPELVNGPATVTPMSNQPSVVNHIYLTAMDTQDVARALGPHGEMLFGIVQRGQRSLGV